MTTILNDTHIGVTRQAGTTPASQAALRAYVLAEFRKLVERTSGHLIINGDLFDGFTIEAKDLISAHCTLDEHLRQDRRLTLIQGNHDSSAKAEKISSFHVLAYVLQGQYPDLVQVVDHNNGFTRVDETIWAIPHMLNQSLFDIEIEKACGQSWEGDTLLLHANCMSPFAEHSDHSLNVSEDQIDALIKSGWQIVFAHEHQPRLFRGGRVTVVGNQIPTSIADCIGNRQNQKYMLKINDKKSDLIPVIDLTTIYGEFDWTDLDSVPDHLKFIRVGGACSAAQAADMVSAIAKLRQKHEAFCISNAVKVEGLAQLEGLAEMSIDAMEKFDVVAALMEFLEPKEQETVKGLLT